MILLMDWVSLDRRLVKKWIKWPAGFIFLTLIIFLLIDHLFPFNPPSDYSQIITARDGTILHVFLNRQDKWRIMAELDEISPELKKTILQKEDKLFYFHFGINPVAIFRALIQNVVSGERVSGASTVTMQLARLIDPKSRTYRNKLTEMFRAVQLEWHFSKNEILQMYLNHLPYGGNIEGVKTASLIYYDQLPRALSLAQIVTLSIIPNNPAAFLYAKDDQTLLDTRNHWLDIFDRRGLFSAQMIRDAKEEPLGLEKHPLPRYIPHLACRLHREIPGPAVIRTYIDSELQSRIQTITWNHVRTIRGKGIRNASVIIIDNQTGDVISYLGSADFDDASAYGQVDGVRSVRSPGSTLKPFLYALAIDKGLITPATVVTDVPGNFGGYQPENYDGGYRGLISVKNALALSLNIPAVELMDELSKDFFIQMLGRAGFQTISNKQEELGLSLILGGCGVTLEELTSLFFAFARQGVYCPVHYYQGQPGHSCDTLISAPAVYMVSEMMTSLKRPDFPVKAEQIIDLPRIAWKTGTSYGRRDAWSIGYDPDFTVGVWVGNFDGTGVPELNGTDFAAPLLFRIFRILDEKNPRAWFPIPAELKTREVCARSGLLPSSFCTDIIEDVYIPGISPSQRCQHMRSVFVNADSSVSFCRSCLPQSGYREKLYRNYPPEVIAYMNEQGLPYESIPRHNPSCERVFYENAPQISSLTDNAEYILFRDENQRLKLACQAENDVVKIFWYVNNKFLSATSIHEALFFEPPEGEVKISCLDDKGRNTDIWIQVKFI
jgi:penicillin-binding protein 1C